MPALAIGPANYAGQATAWASAVNRKNNPAWSFTFAGGAPPFQFRGDREFPRLKQLSAPRLKLADAQIWPVLEGATHVALDGFEPLSGSRLTRSLHKDIQELQAKDIAVALIAHGSDVRNPLEHRRRVPHSWFYRANLAYLTQLTRVSARNRAFAKHSGLPTFVSTPDLLNDLPQATWLPLVVDLPEERLPVLATDKPTVLHLPSRRNPPIKGTPWISAALRGLAVEGLITYLEPEQMPHEQLLQLLKNCDIVVDQILSDHYSVAAVEAMAAGCVTIASVYGSRDLLPENPPIVDANPDTIKDVVYDIVTNPEPYQKLSNDAMRYVQRWHNGDESARRLRKFLNQG